MIQPGKKELFRADARRGVHGARRWMNCGLVTMADDTGMSVFGGVNPLIGLVREEMKGRKKGTKSGSRRSRKSPGEE